MLCEIYCDKFHQKKIEFKGGFNVVLGTNTGDNSIGKSTFMLIIDFVFGGSTYSQATDILDNVGDHTISYKFVFNNAPYYFSRTFLDRNVVWKCDAEYNKTEPISTTEYCKWLASQYQLNLFELSLRDAVGRYIRAYGKDNCNEKLPLHVVPAEGYDTATTALLKLFNRYKIIFEIKDRAKNSADKLKIYTNAQRLNFISKIDKCTYSSNQKEIDCLHSEIEELENGLQHGLLDVDSAASEEAIRVKKSLSQAKRFRSGILNKLSTLNDNEGYKFSSTTEAFTELVDFFPNCNIKHIDEIEKFHKNIVGVFKKELRAEKLQLSKVLAEYDEIIENLENELMQLIHDPKLSKIILQKHADSLKMIEQMQKENDTYVQQVKLNETKKVDEESLRTIKNEQFGIIEKQINHEMEQINKQLYVEHYNAPVIHFTESTYYFHTPNDTGTGIAYKGLVVFDLAIAKLTKLPILVHDSVVLKQISDDAIENIINQYIACKKQVVIALDKQQSYTDKTSKLLEKYAILQLAPNGKELFGKSWGKKK